MAESAENTSTGLDNIKLGIAVLVLATGFAGFYHFAEQPQLYRVLGLLVFVSVAAAIALTTAKGKSLTSYMQAVRVEVRKMVWPTRTETMQTTGVIMVVVLIMGLFFWLLDMLLAWIMRAIIG